MFIYTIWDIIIFGVLGLIISVGIIYIIIKSILDIGKKNCYECKHYTLDNVAGCGDCCFYKCKLYNRKDDGVSFNETTHLERCKAFEEKERI